MVRLTLLVLMVGVTTACAQPQPQTIRVEVTADTNLSSYPSERPWNYGGTARARLKGYEMWYLARPDLAPLAGQRIVGARFVFRPIQQQFRTLGFSTIAAPWVEGTANAEAADSGATFLERGDGQPWARPGGDFTDVAWTVGHTQVSVSEVETRPDGTMAAAIDPALLAACVAGASDGLAITDEIGQTRFNNDIATIEQSNMKPWFEVDVIPAAAPTGAAAGVTLEPWPARDRVGRGAARLRFDLVADAAEVDRLALGLTVNGEPWPRWATPRLVAGGNVVILEDLPAGAPLQVELRIGAPVDQAPAVAVAGAASAGLPVPVLGDMPPGPPAFPAAGPARAVAAWTSVDPLTGALADGAEARLDTEAGLALAGARGELVAVQLITTSATPPALGPLAGPGGAALVPDAPQALTYVPAPGPVAEIVVPAGHARAVDGQQFWPHLVELYIPPGTPPGAYTGTWAGLPVALTVWQHTLPANLNFHVALNSYGRVHGMYGVNDGESDAALAVERAYHRIAHRYRCTWQLLGYGHGGTQDWGAGPLVTADGGLDWTNFERRWGGYLDGSAFADLPRAGVPVAYVYLTLAEHWPTPMTAYQWQPTTTDWPDSLIEHALGAPPIAEAFPPDYAQRFEDVTTQIAQHTVDQGWQATTFHGYLNDKYNYKDPAQGGRGVSWWLLDEPAHRDDWLALKWYGDLFRAGHQKVPGAPLVWRADVSRPQWQRDYLDSSMDLAVFGGEYFTYQRRMSDWLRDHNAVTWVYGTANPPGQSNLTLIGWCLRAWLAGADGVVPWNSIGNPGSYNQPDETGLMLPGAPVGVDGPLPSLRLLAFLAGQQEVERLALLAAQRGWTREQMAQALGSVLQLEVATESRFAEDAGTFRFDQLTPAQVERLRQVVAAELERTP